ncbi:MAG: hypothetical protein ACTSUG_00255 [Candidatus Helarchaeota archaeon]
MVRKGYILTEKELAELFLILSQARIKLNGKICTSADKYWQKCQEALGLNLDT